MNNQCRSIVVLKLCDLLSVRALLFDRHNSTPVAKHLELPPVALAEVH